MATFEGLVKLNWEEFLIYFFHPLFFLLDPGWKKTPDPGSRINVRIGNTCDNSYNKTSI
jgi:hypothetical protein